MQMPGYPQRDGGFTRRDRGFTLVEIAVVIVILGILLTMLLGISSSMIAQQRREATRARLAAVETALALFASQYQRLPCPADGSMPNSNANAGLEITSGTGTAITCHLGGGVNSQTKGVVPWRSLGLDQRGQRSFARALGSSHAAVQGQQRSRSLAGDRWQARAALHRRRQSR